MCIYIHVYICIHTHIYTHRHMCIYVCIRTLQYTHTYTYMVIRNREFLEGCHLYFWLVYPFSHLRSLAPSNVNTFAYLLNPVIYLIEWLPLYPYNKQIYYTRGSSEFVCSFLSHLSCLSAQDRTYGQIPHLLIT